MARFWPGLSGLFLLLCILWICMPAAEASKPFGEADEKFFLEKVWAGRQLDPVEGIWAVKSGKTTMRVAIARNTTEKEKEYGFLGVSVDKEGFPWRAGDLCLVLKKGAAANTYDAVWITPVVFFVDRFATTLTLNAAGDEFTVGYRAGFAATTLTAARVGPALGPRVATGSGFFLTPTLVVTNAHLVAAAAKITVDFGGDVRPAQRVAVDKANDLALLRVEGLEYAVKPLALAAGRMTTGERVYAAGFPTPGVLGRGLKFAEGLVNSTTGLADDPRACQIGISVAEGLSGGPLLNARGQVVGVVVHAPALTHYFYKGQAIPAGVNFAIKAGNILALLDSLPEEARPAAAEGTQAPDTAKVAEMAAGAVVLVEVK
jgi:S1-C subfamily serine protease